MEILQVPVTDTADVTSVDNGAAVNVRVFNITNRHQTDLLMKIQEIDGSGIPLMLTRRT